MPRRAATNSGWEIDDTEDLRRTESAHRKTRSSNLPQTIRNCVAWTLLATGLPENGRNGQ